MKNNSFKSVSVHVQLLWRAVLAAATMAVVATTAHAAPAIDSWKLDNGAQVYFMQTDAMPIVDVQIDFDAGSRRDPAEQAGLAEMAALMLAKGAGEYENAPAKNEAQMSNAWSDIGAELAASASADRFGFRLRSLSTQPLLDSAVALAVQQMGAPTWDATIWQRERERVAAGLAEADTRPGTRASKAYAKAVYQGHPYGYKKTAQTLRAISADDLAAFYRKSMRPCHAKISIVAGMNKQQATALANRLMGAFKPDTACQPLKTVPTVQALAQPVTKQIDFDAAQAYIFVGQPGYTRSDPDHLALYVGNYILGGGGFVSRLVTEVREKRGLTYGVGSYFNAGLHAGAFTVSLQTRPQQAQQALQVVREVLADFVQQGPTDAELKAAKNNLANSMGLRTDSNAKLLGYLAYIAWYDLPLTYLDDWRGAINAVSKEQVKKAFARVLKPEAMATVVLGGAVSEVPKQSKDIERKK